MARTRNGFTSRLRQELMKRFQPLAVAACPFANLPEAKSGRWGAGLTAKKMVDCRWLKPVLVGQFEFVEWTGEHHLRHSRFMGLRDDTDARRRERAVGTTSIPLERTHDPHIPDAPANRGFGDSGHRRREASIGDAHRRKPSRSRTAVSLDDAEDAVIEVTKRLVTGDLPRGARESSWSPISFSRFPSSVYA